MKLCKDCKFCSYNSDYPGLSRCRHPIRKEREERYVDLVRGHETVPRYPSFCDYARDNVSGNDPCGLAGRQWEPKATPITFFKKLKGLFTK